MDESLEATVTLKRKYEQAAHDARLALEEAQKANEVEAVSAANDRLGRAIDDIGTAAEALNASRPK